MAGSFALPTVLANLTAGNQPLSLIDGDLSACATPLNSLNTFSNGYIDSGAANAYVITVSSPQTVSQAQFLRVQFITVNANTGASTLQINALAAKNIKNIDGTNLAAGQIPANGIVDVMYDGTQYLLLSSGTASVNSKIISFSRVAATATGSVSYTGVGFKPRALQGFGGATGGVNMTWNGQCDSALTQFCMFDATAGVPQFEGSFLSPGIAGARQQFVVTSLDADGFTGTWTKIGAPGFTATLMVICFR